jgi:hypothetical protein
MEYLSAIGSLILFMLLGCGAVAILYVIWNEKGWFRLPARSDFAWPRPSPSNVRFSTALVICVAVVAGIGGYIESYKGPKGETGEPGIPGPRGPLENSIRTVTSTSCPKDGCPTSCTDEEWMISAFCVSGKTARLSNAVAPVNGVLTAKCVAGSDRIIMYCGHK